MKLEDIKEWAKLNWEFDKISEIIKNNLSL